MLRRRLADLCFVFNLPTLRRDENSECTFFDGGGEVRCIEGYKRGSRMPIGKVLF